MVIAYLNTYWNLMSNPDNYHERLTRDWVPLALTDPGSLCGLFLSARRHVALCHGPGPRSGRFAISYEVTHPRALNEAISVGISAPTDLPQPDAFVHAVQGSLGNRPRGPAASSTSTRTPTKVVAPRPSWVRRRFCRLRCGRSLCAGSPGSSEIPGTTSLCG
jgi:hypothetical protein